MNSTRNWTHVVLVVGSPHCICTLAIVAEAALMLLLLLLLQNVTGIWLTRGVQGASRLRRPVVLTTAFCIFAVGLGIMHFCDCRKGVLYLLLMLRRHWWRVMVLRRRSSHSQVGLWHGGSHAGGAGLRLRQSRASGHGLRRVRVGSIRLERRRHAAVLGRARSILGVGRVAHLVVVVELSSMRVE